MTHPRRILAAARRMRAALGLAPLAPVDPEVWLHKGAHALLAKTSGKNKERLDAIVDIAKYVILLAYVGEVCEAKQSAPVAAAALIIAYITETVSPVPKALKQRLFLALQCSENTSNKRCAEIVNLIRSELENNTLPWYDKDFLGPSSKTMVVQLESLSNNNSTDNDASKSTLSSEVAVVETVGKSYLGSKAFCVKLSAVVKDLKRVALDEESEEDSQDEL
ncbi:hypothetical protein BDR26DRAFT_855353 [Obelidium mucronatum]|nr:hypothetical protein BDR26DRAFT_855353 [Obelidium mucronatum]